MVQIGTTKLPIIVVPRIDGVIRTVTEIKNNFSNAYVDDPTTPINFTLEYKEVGGTVQTQLWDTGDSTDDELFFNVPDSLYASKKEWTIAVYWTIETEKIYVLKPYHLSVEDVHNS